MKLALTSQELSRVRKLIDSKEINIQVADMYLYYFIQAPTAIKKKAVLNLMKKQGCSVEQSFYQQLMRLLDVDLSLPENRKLGEQFFLSGLKNLDANLYKNNPYYQRIRPQPQQSKQWELKYLTYKPYQAFAYDDIFVDSKHYYSELSAIGFFTEPFEYLAVLENNDIWMSVIPHEIHTMAPAIEKVTGSVAVFGLGLGYFAYMASIKASVSKVVIIEKDPQVIHLFKTLILPGFEHPEKIDIIECDAFDYVTKLMAVHSFDYAYIDIWHGAEDGIKLYLQMKKHEVQYPKTQFLYWIENSLLAMLRRLILTLIEETIEKTPKENYLKAANEHDEIINRLYFYFEKTIFSSYEEIHCLLEDDALKSLANVLLAD